MTTLAAQITSSGISAPAYNDILQQLKVSYWTIYGSDANLDPDSQDGALLAVFARAINDCNQIAIAAYNSFRPDYAVGAGLSSVVKINGISRESASNSQATVSVVGVAGTVINGGIVGDNLNLGTQWSLPPTVEIPDAGTIDVTVTCTTAGANLAPAGSLTKILTPTLGWQSATNAAAGAPGAAVELDAALRRRQSNSSALPAMTVLEGIYAAVANIPNVQQVQIYENDGDGADANGIPGHKIAVVALGGDALTIAQTIALKKSPGTGTFGTTSELVLDTNGVPVTINFFPMTEQPIYAVITVKPQQGYTAIVGNKIAQSVADWINGLAIGEDVFYGKLWGPANLFNDGAADGLTFNVSSITVGTAPVPVGVVDIVIPFSARAFCTVANISIVVVP